MEMDIRQAMQLLTNKQRSLVALVKEKGFLTMQDAKIVYSSPIAAKQALERMVALRLLIAEFGCWKWRPYVEMEAEFRAEAQMRLA